MRLQNFFNRRAQRLPVSQQYQHQILILIQQDSLRIQTGPKNHQVLTTLIDLAVDALGDTVKKGDLLFTYYSPDLMNAQSDFLIGSRVGNATQRLRLYGMDDKAIAELKERGKFFEKTPFYAPEDGTVTMLNVRKGGHVNEGGSVLKLQDFSTVWVNADVPIDP